jgi:pimeloyl-ACP methyl ester carboxylesterase
MPAENVLLLPGMMCDARMWLHQVEAMRVPAYHADMTKADNFSDMALQVLDSAPQKFALAGLSMGGILALEICRQAPERITHLALLDTNPHAEQADRKSLRLKQIERVSSGRLRELAVEELKPLYLAKAHRNDEHLLDTILRMALDLGPDVFRAQSIALRDRIDSVPTLSNIDCPTLVLCGAEDTLCPVEYHELMAKQIPNARLSVIDQCGHLSTLEQPEIVSQLLVELFKQ